MYVVLRTGSVVVATPCTYYLVLTLRVLALDFVIAVGSLLRQLAVVVRVAFATQRCMINKLSEQCTAIAHAKIAGNNPERTKAGCTASLRTLLKRSAKKLHAV